MLQLKNTERLMQNKAANEDFDSYAVYVRCGDFEHTFFSENVNEDTYFDLASCGKILVTTPLILQAIGEDRLRLDSKLDASFGAHIRNCAASICQFWAGCGGKGDTCATVGL